MRVALLVLKTGGDLFLQFAPDEVFHPLGRIVQVVERQFGLLAEIRFP